MSTKIFVNSDFKNNFPDHDKSVSDPIVFIYDESFFPDFDIGGEFVEEDLTLDEFHNNYPGAKLKVINLIPVSKQKKQSGVQLTKFERIDDVTNQTNLTLELTHRNSDNILTHELDVVSMPHTVKLSLEEMHFHSNEFSPNEAIIRMAQRLNRISETLSENSDEIGFIIGISKPKLF